MLKTLQKNNLLCEINRNASLMLSKIFDFGIYEFGVSLTINSVNDIVNRAGFECPFTPFSPLYPGKLIPVPPNNRIPIYPKNEF